MALQPLPLCLEGGLSLPGITAEPPRCPGDIPWWGIQRHVQQSHTKEFMDVGEFQASLGYIWRPCVEREKNGHAL